MDIKSMLIKLAEQQAEKMQEEAVKHLGSDEMSEKIATAINKRVDIPFVSEEKEQIFFGIVLKMSQQTLRSQKLIQNQILNIKLLFRSIMPAHGLESALTALEDKDMRTLNVFL